MKHLKIKISGPRVQGVGFRWCIYEKFVELGLQGRAENGRDNSVLVDTEGEEEKLSQLIEWCRKGPAGARVARVDSMEAAEPFIPLKNS